MNSMVLSVAAALPLGADPLGVSWQEIPTAPFVPVGLPMGVIDDTAWIVNSSYGQYPMLYKSADGMN